jgi:hypothetical protein
VAFEPVKCSPANIGCASTGPLTVEPCPGMKLITPGGRPASINTCISTQLDRIDVLAGFHSVVFPISATDVFRFDAIAVKLNGVTVKTKPSSDRYSIRFSSSGPECGWSE